MQPIGVCKAGPGTLTGTGVIASGNATDTQVLTGTTYSNDSGASTGTMANNGAVTLTPTTTNVAIAAGYHNGSGYVISDTDLISGNIKSGVTLFGVDGTLSSGSTYNAGVGSKTGQTWCYGRRNTIDCGGSSYPGQDGDYTKGISVSVRFTDNLSGTVTDNLTGLIWLKNANCTDTVGGIDPSEDSPADKLNWAEALTWSNNLADGKCDLTDGSSAGDWRLPNLRELQSLVHYGFPPSSGPYFAVPNTAGTGQWSAEDPFISVQSDNYWSSSTVAFSLMLLSFALAGSVTRRFWAKNAGHGPAESLKNRILSSIGL